MEDQMYSTSVDGQMLYGHSLGSLVDAVKRYYTAKLTAAHRAGAIEALEGLWEIMYLNGCPPSVLNAIKSRCRALAALKGE